jgi:hypothetical protein
MFLSASLRDAPLTASEPLINHAPKRRDRSPFFIEEVFEEPWFVEWRWI